MSAYGDPAEVTEYAALASLGLFAALFVPRAGGLEHL